jgi:hypothetical protein
VVVGAKGQTRGCWGLLMLRVIRGGCDGVKNEERFIRRLTNGVRRTSWFCQKPVRFRNGDVIQKMNEGEEKVMGQNTCGPPVKIGKDLAIMTP